MCATACIYKGGRIIDRCFAQLCAAERCTRFSTSSFSLLYRSRTHTQSSFYFFFFFLVFFFLSLYIPLCPNDAIGAGQREKKGESLRRTRPTSLFFFRRVSPLVYIYFCFFQRPNFFFFLRIYIQGVVVCTDDVIFAQ